MFNEDKWICRLQALAPKCLNRAKQLSGRVICEKVKKCNLRKILKISNIFGNFTWPIVEHEGKGNIRETFF